MFLRTLPKFPNNSSEWEDTDGDGLGNNVDSDDDNDGIRDEIDLFPLDSKESIDSDSDWVGDFYDPDPFNPNVPYEELIPDKSQSSLSKPLWLFAICSILLSGIILTFYLAFKRKQGRKIG